MKFQLIIEIPQPSNPKWIQKLDRALGAEAAAESQGTMKINKILTDNGLIVREIKRVE